LILGNFAELTEIFQPSSLTNFSKENHEKSSYRHRYVVRLQHRLGLLSYVHAIPLHRSYEWQANVRLWNVIKTGESVAILP